jgi:ribose transport system permease protein
MISSFADSDFAEFVRRSRSALLAAALLLGVLVFVIRLSPGAFSYFDFSNMVGSGASLALAAMGQALVVLTGGFDLSAGAVVSLTNVVVASTMGDSVSSQVGGALLALAIGAAVGAVNGFFIAILRMQSIVVTLSTLFVVQGLALLVRPTPGGSVPQSFTNVFSGAAIPNLVPAPLVVVAVAIAIWLLIKNSPFGTAIYAVGSDQAAAASAGVRVRRTKFWAYVISGVFYAAAGIFIAAQTGGSDPLVGQPMLLQVFTAVVLGGTVLGGGRGGLVGAVIGAYLLMLFVNVLLILDVPAYYSPMTDGAILLLAVLAGSKWRAEGSPLWNVRELARSWRAQGRAARPPLAPIDSSAREADPQNTWLRRNQETLRSMLPAYIALVVVVAATAIYFGGVGGKYFSPLLVLSSFLGFLAFGQGVVILTGGLDLSIPWTITACAIFYGGWVQGHDVAALWATPAVLGVGALIGLVNGFGITVLGLPPMVMTLGANGIVQGVALVYSQGTPLGFGPPAVRWLTTGSLFGVTPVIWLFILFAILVTAILQVTSFGRRVYAVGNSPEVANLSGVNVRATLTGAYMISGVCSAIVGILLVGYNGQASLGMGDDYLLPSIAVVVAGGVVITGGKGHYLGIVGGVLLLTALQILLGGMPLPFAVRGIIQGLVVLGALITLREDTAT